MIHVPTQQKIQFGQKLADFVETQTIMDDIRDSSNASRVILWKCNNGPGIHKLGFDIYLKVLQSSHEPPFRLVGDRYDGLKIYANYSKMLQTIYANQMTAYNIGSYPEGLIANIHRDAGALWTGFYAVGEDKIEKSFYFMTIDSAEAESPYEIGTGSALDLGVNKMRGMFKYLNDSTLIKWRKKLYI